MLRKLRAEFLSTSRDNILVIRFSMVLSKNVSSQFNDHYRVDAVSSDTRTLFTLVHVQLTQVTSEARAALTREATGSSFRARGTIETGSSVTVCSAAGVSGVARWTGAGEGGDVVGADRVVAAGRVSAVVDGSTVWRLVTRGALTSWSSITVHSTHTVLRTLET